MWLERKPRPEDANDGMKKPTTARVEKGKGEKEKKAWTGPGNNRLVQRWGGGKVGAKSTVLLGEKRKIIRPRRGATPMD